MVPDRVPGWCGPGIRPGRGDHGRHGAAGRGRGHYVGVAPGGGRPACRSAVEHAAQRCADLGHDVAEAAPAVPEGYFQWFLIVFPAGVAQEFALAEEITGVTVRRAEVEASTWLCRQLGRALSAEAL